jgi:hypothetical protein|tara:strand:+ start:1961 stop:2272 length:312 start_codon:yes stop_codon:yes gene_type:complete
MSPSKLGVFANLALVASAVLIPPTITADYVGDDNAMEGLVIDPFKRSAVLECPGCAFATQEEDKLSWKQNVGNAFVSTSPSLHGCVTSSDFSLASGTRSSGHC